MNEFKEPSNIEDILESEVPKVPVQESVEDELKRSQRETNEDGRTEFFTEEPEEIISYQFGDPVRRENFINFLIYSFAISRGDIAVQQVFFKWISKTSGVNVEDIIDQFGVSGSVHALSQKEVKVFEDAFYAVSKHHKVFQEHAPEEVDDEILDGLAQISNPTEHLDDIMAQYYDLDTINTLQEFNACTRVYFEKTRANKMR